MPHFFPPPPKRPPQKKKKKKIGCLGKKEPLVSCSGLHISSEAMRMRSRLLIPYIYTAYIYPLYLYSSLPRMYMFFKLGEKNVSSLVILSQVWVMPKLTQVSSITTLKQVSLSISPGHKFAIGGGGKGRRKNLDHCFVKHTNLLFPPFPSNEFSAGAGLLAPSPLQSKVYSRSLRANVCPGTA